MALPVKDGNDADVYWDVEGTGTAQDPHRAVTAEKNSAAILAALQSGLGSPSLPTGAATNAAQVTLQTAMGATTDVEATADGSLIALVKRLRTLLGSVATQTTLAALNTATGTQADAESTGDGSLISIQKRIRTLLGSIATETTLAAVNLAVGTQGSAESTSGNGSITGLLKNLRTRLTDLNTSVTASNTALGNTTDVEATSDGSVIAQLKRLKTLLAGTLLTKLVDNTGAQVSSSNPLNVIQAQLTDANDEVRANQYLYSELAAAWAKRRFADSVANSSFGSVATGATNILIAAPGAGVRWRLHKITVSSSVAGEIQLQDPSGTIKVRHVLPANESREIPMPEGGWLSAAANNSLAIRNNTGSTANLVVTAWYNTEAG